MRGKHGKHTEHVKFLTLMVELFQIAILKSCQTVQGSDSSSERVHVNTLSEIFHHLQTDLSNVVFYKRAGYEQILCFRFFVCCQHIEGPSISRQGLLYRNCS